MMQADQTRIRQMARLYLQEHKTLQQIGDQYGLTRQRVCQVLELHCPEYRALPLKGRRPSRRVPRVPYQPQRHPDKFWTLVEKSDGCWLWQGTRYPSGYGHLSMPGVGGNSAGYAHRHAWELTHGPIPTGMWVLHKCDTPPCVNPDHLYLGTAQDNARDRAERSLGPRRWLTDAEVETIRQLATKNLPVRDIAIQLGRHPRTVLNVLIGRTHKISDEAPMALAS